MRFLKTDMEKFRKLIQNFIDGSSVKYQFLVKYVLRNFPSTISLFSFEKQICTLYENLSRAIILHHLLSNAQKASRSFLVIDIQVRV